MSTGDDEEEIQKVLEDWANRQAPEVFLTTHALKELCNALRERAWITVKQDITTRSVAENE